MYMVKACNPANLLAGVSVAVVLILQAACTPAPPVVAQPNQAPVIESINYARDAFGNSDLQIDCTAKDADGDQLTYKWTAEAGEIKGSGKNIVWVSPGKMGTYPIIVEVTDGKGGAATENISIRVLTNLDGTATPVVEIKLKLGDAVPVIVDKQRARIWMTTDILCVVENAGDAGDLTYTWSATDGKMQGEGLKEGKASKIRWTAPGVKSDITINVTVTDSQGREAKGQVNLNVFCCGN